MSLPRARTASLLFCVFSSFGQACGGDTPVAAGDTGFVLPSSAGPGLDPTLVGDGGPTNGDDSGIPAPTPGGGGLDAGLNGWPIPVPGSDAGNPGNPADDAGAGDADTTDAGFPDGGEPDSDTPDASEPDPDPDPQPPRFPAVDSLSEPGPFATQNPAGSVEGPNCVVHRPATLGENGLQHPVILWGLGTGGFNTYQAAYELWASHGFIVAAGLSGNGQGSGAEMLGCLAYVCEQYAPHVDCHAGASGHSQGGGGAIMVGRDPRVLATAPVQPYVQWGLGGFQAASIEEQTGPMLLLSGSADFVADPASNQQPVFDTTNVPVFWGTAVGVDHVGPGVDGLVAYRESILAWFRLHLMGDESFRDMFYGADCSLCDEEGWLVQRREMD